MVGLIALVGGKGKGRSEPSLHVFVEDEASAVELMAVAETLARQRR